MFDDSRKLYAVHVICAAILTLVSGCKQAPTTKHYPISGKVLGKSVSTQQITLDAGDVPGFMPAMTMAYKLPNAAVLEELQPGDRIAAQLAVDPADASHFWIEDVVITEEVAHNEPPARLPPRELFPGEAIPDVVMVDQEDKTFHLRDYKGKAVLLTFIYTRCPMPTYCPMITSHFSRIHDALKKYPTLYAHSQLVSITLDPGYDTPSVMKKYGLAYVDGSADDLKTWTFASTSPDDLKKLASAFGLEYFQDGNQISHSMSTVLLGKDGRVAQVWKGNDWKMGRPAGSNGTRRSKVMTMEQLAKAFLIGGLAAIVASAIVVWAIGGLRPGLQLTDTQETGKAYYGQNCASCHEENQLELKKVPPNLHGLFNRSKLPSGTPATDAEVHNVILRGKNTMPSFDQRLSDEQVSDIIAYLHTGIR